MKMNGSLRGSFNCLSEAGGSQPGGGNYANVTWKCTNGGSQNDCARLDSWRVKG